MTRTTGQRPDLKDIKVGDKVTVVLGTGEEKQGWVSKVMKLRVYITVIGRRTYTIAFSKRTGEEIDGGVILPKCYIKS